MKRILCILSALIFTLCFSACGSGGGDDPITAVRPGMTMEKVLELEPDLTESSKDGMLHCKRSFDGVEGWLFVNFYSTESEKIALNVGWDAEPEENGKKVYRDLLSGLKSCYGKPTSTATIKADESNTDAVSRVNWSTEDFIGSLVYSEDTETGACRVQYVSGHS